MADDMLQLKQFISPMEAEIYLNNRTFLGTQNVKLTNGSNPKFSFVQYNSEPYDSMCLSNDFQECNVLCRENNGLLMRMSGHHYCLRFAVISQDCKTDLLDC